MARLATLMRDVSKSGAKWSPQPRSAPLRAVESPTMKTVGSAGFSAASWGVLLCAPASGGAVGLRHGDPNFQYPSEKRGIPLCDGLSR